MIEDDVYLFELGHQETTNPAPQNIWIKTVTSFWCGSFSKTSRRATTWVVWFRARYFRALPNQHALTSFGVNGLMQSCMQKFITRGEYRLDVKKLRVPYWTSTYSPQPTVSH